MFRQHFGNVEVVKSPGFGLYFRFDDDSVMPDGHIERSPFYFSDGLGEIHSHDGSDLTIHNRGDHAGVVIPDWRNDPDAGLWVKAPSKGHKATFWVDNGTTGKYRILSLKSQDVDDIVNDVQPIEFSSRVTNVSFDLHSELATWYFLQAEGAEGLLRWGTFLKWPPF